VLRDVFLPLCSGATLCIPPANTELSPQPLFAWMRQESISYFHTVPSIAGFWLNQKETDISLPSLRRVFFAGEPLTQATVKQWQQRVNPA
ncbi:AMP-binding protein, partial [Xenorhabdus bovienii]|uniref:AMP-binding protein n=1 Tax=Xenorhabdus bovienii TaxID=40576 RepID=UPI0023B26AC5